MVNGSILEPKRAYRHRSIIHDFTIAKETHGKAMGVGDDERMIEPRGVALGAEPR
jgi:hypothetical protein